jgi:hypothetical protein
VKSPATTPQVRRLPSLPRKYRTTTLVFGALKRDRRGGVRASRWRVIPNEIVEVDL